MDRSDLASGIDDSFGFLPPRARHGPTSANMNGPPTIRRAPRSVRWNDSDGGALTSGVDDREGRTRGFTDERHDKAREYARRPTRSISESLLNRLFKAGASERRDRKMGTLREEYEDDVDRRPAQPQSVRESGTERRYQREDKIRVPREDEDYRGIRIKSRAGHSEVIRAPREPRLPSLSSIKLDGPRSKGDEKRRTRPDKIRAVASEPSLKSARSASSSAGGIRIVGKDGRQVLMPLSRDYDVFSSTAATTPLRRSTPREKTKEEEITDRDAIALRAARRIRKEREAAEMSGAILISTTRSGSRVSNREADVGEQFVYDQPASVVKADSSTKSPPKVMPTQLTRIEEEQAEIGYERKQKGASAKAWSEERSERKARDDMERQTQDVSVRQRKPEQTPANQRSQGHEETPGRVSEWVAAAQQQTSYQTWEQPRASAVVNNGNESIAPAWQQPRAKSVSDGAKKAAGEDTKQPWLPKPTRSASTGFWEHSQASPSPWCPPAVNETYAGSKVSGGEQANRNKDIAPQEVREDGYQHRSQSSAAHQPYTAYSPTRQASNSQGKPESPRSTPSMTAYPVDYQPSSDSYYLPYRRTNASSVEEPQNNISTAPFADTKGSFHHTSGGASNLYPLPLFTPQPTYDQLGARGFAQPVPYQDPGYQQQHGSYDANSALQQSPAGFGVYSASPHTEYLPPPYPPPQYRKGMAPQPQYQQVPPPQPQYQQPPYPLDQHEAAAYYPQTEFSHPHAQPQQPYQWSAVQPIAQQATSGPSNTRPQTVFAGHGWIPPHPLSIPPSDVSDTPQRSIEIPPGHPAGRVANSKGEGTENEARKMTYTQWLKLQEDESAFNMQRNLETTGATQGFAIRAMAEQNRAMAATAAGYGGAGYGSPAYGSTGYGGGWVAAGSGSVRSDGRVRLRMPWDR